jgi:hypothetical protein
MRYVKDTSNGDFCQVSILQDGLVYNIHILLTGVGSRLYKHKVVSAGTSSDWWSLPGVECCPEIEAIFITKWSQVNAQFCLAITPMPW